MLTLVLPSGIVAYIYGLISAWENDVGALNLSGLNGHLIALQPNIKHEWALGLESLYYSVYTDSIFPFLDCVTHQHEPPCPWCVTRKGGCGKSRNVCNAELSCMALWGGYHFISYHAV